MTAGYLERMERIALGLTLVVALVWGVVDGVHPAVSVLAGGLVGLVNFRVLRRLIGRLLSGPPEVARATSLLLSLKLAALAVVLWVLLNQVGLSPIPFCVGLSAIFPSMMLALLGGIGDIDAPIPASSPSERPAS